MINLLELLAAYPIWSVILISVASIIIILKIIDWGKQIWAKRIAFKEAAILEGEKLQKKEDDEGLEKQ